MENDYKQLTEEAREAILVAISKLEAADKVAPDALASERLERYIARLYRTAYLVRTWP